MMKRKSDVTAFKLEQVVEFQHVGTATLAQSVPIFETFKGSTVWEGAVSGPRLLRCTGFHGMIGQGLAERPNRARHAMAIGDRRLKGAFDPLAIRIRYDERRKKLHGVIRVARDLGKNFMILKQRDCDELA